MQPGLALTSVRQVAMLLLVGAGDDDDNDATDCDKLYNGIYHCDVVIPVFVV